ncbi:MAG: hypothetical protein M3480_05565 [Verrucomicrobiota bacterium]|nr:hypothetical protein [Verrucomicrobiota bacterium]
MKNTEKMGDYQPSTLIDYRAGRPLEIEPIWGEPLRAAKAAKMHAPHLAKLYRELGALEQAERK